MNEWKENKPLDWEKYLNKEVKVTADEKNTYQGWVFTVDPVSGSIVLVNFVAAGKVSVVTVMGHAIQAVELINEGETNTTEKLSSLFMPAPSRTYSSEELQHRKCRLKSWLEKNLIPVREQGEESHLLCVAGVLTVSPPYNAEDCNSSNEIILSRVQSLINCNPEAAHKNE
ncbi:gem-associated protein 6 [Amblyraja radiata]|uniref:gem-associated protein 6 n=1 Tax=Amblyraja radiata TaxID=386614 RepID=UPI0014038317|nr:gem-associated protein 6 [Amblyraja radiata]XP_032881670.1 gem-associated protein 6 [Amblyraja radiata]XP_032881671.1 gem-associated protein 6 [Amblyraja radiata]